MTSKEQVSLEPNLKKTYNLVSYKDCQSCDNCYNRCKEKYYSLGYQSKKEAQDRLVEIIKYLGIGFIEKLNIRFEIEDGPLINLNAMKGDSNAMMASQVVDLPAEIINENED